MLLNGLTRNLVRTRRKSATDDCRLTSGVLGGAEGHLRRQAKQVTRLLGRPTCRMKEVLRHEYEGRRTERGANGESIAVDTVVTIEHEFVGGKTVRFSYYSTETT